MPFDLVRVADTRAWLTKAAQDLRRVEILLAAEPPDSEGAISHSPQAAEKALKGFLTWHDVPFRKVHELDVIGEQCADIDSSLSNVVNRAVRTAGRHSRGVRWEELHLHFPWYGLMIPPADVKSWEFRESPHDITVTRDKVRLHTQTSRAKGVGTFVYYNVTESVHDYATKHFPESIARDESGKPVGAWMIAKYPSVNACWLMNADPASSFGKHMIAQAHEMVDAYPEAAGFFWDVYGRSYMFDFAHDDGITMVNNKPVYYPEFM